VKQTLESEHGCRSLDIGPKLVVILRASHEEQELERAAAPEWEDNDLVFCHPSHGPAACPPDAGGTPTTRPTPSPS
jgi:hypothetical protein